MQQTFPIIASSIKSFMSSLMQSHIHIHIYADTYRYSCIHRILQELSFQIFLARTSKAVHLI